VQFASETQVDEKWGGSPRHRKRLLNQRLGSCLLLVAGVLAFGGTLFGHHGGASWDAKTTITLKGVVTEFRFINPHAQIYFDVTDDSGNAVHWTCEAADPAMLVRQGWSHKMLKPGDHVTFIGHPAKAGAKLMALEKLILADGQEMDAKGAAN
jgi:hypothetical protein